MLRFRKSDNFELKNLMNTKLHLDESRQILKRSETVLRVLVNHACSMHNRVQKSGKVVLNMSEVVLRTFEGRGEQARLLLLELIVRLTLLPFAINRIENEKLK